MTAVADTGVDASEAWAFVEQLEERVREGDTTVLPSEIAAARSHAQDLEHFERLQRDHLAREDARAAERRRQQDAAEIRAELVELADAQELLDAFDAAVGALRALDAVAQDRAARVAGVHGRAMQLAGPEEFGLRLGGLQQTDFSAVALTAQPGPALRVRYVDPAHLVEAALRTARGQDEPHAGMNEVADLRRQRPTVEDS